MTLTHISWKHIIAVLFGALMAAILLAQTVHAAEVDEVEPEMVNPAGGTQVTLTGSGFWPTEKKSQIKVGGIRLTDAIASTWTDTEVVFTMPKVSSGSNPLRIMVYDYEAKEWTEGPWIYLQPTVSSITTPSRAYPDMGTAGTKVTIIGKNFTTKGALLIDEEEAQIVTWTPTKIEALIPEGAEEGEVTIAVYSLNTEDNTVEAKAPSLYILPGLSNDALASENQWYIAKTSTNAGWEESTGNTKTVVAVISDGVDTNHYNLLHNIWRNKKERTNNGKDDDGNGFIDDVHGWNFSSKKNDATLYGSQGTAAAGIIAARGNNGAGIAGITWSSKIMPLTVRPGKTAIEQYVQAIKYATDNGADIIYLAVTDAKLTNTYSVAWNQAIEYAYNNDVIVVTGAGDMDATADTQPLNLNTSPVSPVCNDNQRNMVLGVTATDRFDVRAPFAAYGSNCIDVAAPGTNMLTTMPYSMEKKRAKTYDPRTSGYGVFSGTNMAAAMVAGQAALLKDQFPDANNAQIIDLIKQSAEEIDEANPHYIGQLGTGRINVEESLLSEPDEELKEGRVLGVATSVKSGGSLKVGPGSVTITTFDEERKTLRPLGKSYRGPLFVRQVVMDDGVAVYVVVPTGKVSQRPLLVYNDQGQVISRLRPFVHDADRAFVSLVKQFNGRAYVVVAQPNDPTVHVYRVSTRGLIDHQALALARKTPTSVTAAFLPVYSKKEFGLVIMVNGQPKTLRVWRYSLTERKYVLDKGFDRNKIAVAGNRVSVK